MQEQMQEVVLVVLVALVALVALVVEDNQYILMLPINQVLDSLQITWEWIPIWVVMVEEEVLEVEEVEEEAEEVLVRDP